MEGREDSHTPTWGTSGKSHPTPCLGFLICQVGVITASASQGAVRTTNEITENAGTFRLRARQCKCPSSAGSQHCSPNQLAKGWGRQPRELRPGAKQPGKA